MAHKSDLGKRMKEYESVSKTKLMRRTPVAIRLDGRSFHVFTHGFDRPFDDILKATMEDTMKYLCKNIQGCVIGYQQSDEITLILTDYAELTTNAWFDYKVQKVCSVSASMATMKFNQLFPKTIQTYYNYEQQYTYIKEHYVGSSIYKADKDREKYYEILKTSAEKGAQFDSRCFNIPREEVTNLLYWRQSDAMRNSIQMIGRVYFSNKQLYKKSCAEIQDMLLKEKNINWNNYPIYNRRGSCCIRNASGDWLIDHDIPIFKDKGREYVEKLIQ